ncbi:unnamed protein product [Echinostoma caproni]|uniref:Kinesin motor domain-containing protein n=1 Tax=Echinostoma caproni TaxID=27848 RepID=A0A183AKH4_9TREM|nr:unnamed protein product [Echinostoma caproni]
MQRYACDGHSRILGDFDGDLSTATNLCTAGELAKLKLAQRATIRLVIGLRGTSYEGRLQATANVMEEKTDAAFKWRLDEQLKGLWRNKHMCLELGPSSDGAHTGILSSALNTKD